MQGYNSQSNNIYSSVQPNYTGYSPQYGGNIYAQPSANVYAQSGWNNSGYGNNYMPSVQKNSIDVQKTQAKVTTVTAPSPSVEPLSPSSNEVNTEKNSFFKVF